jgi:hypothetical protein
VTDVGAARCRCRAGIAGPAATSGRGDAQGRPNATICTASLAASTGTLTAANGGTVRGW